MRIYEPKNGNVIGLSRREETMSKGGIILAETARKTNRVLEVISTDTDIVDIGDKIIVDLSSGSILEDAAEGIVIAVPEDEIIAVIRKDDDE